MAPCCAGGSAARNGEIAAGEEWLREAELLHDAGWPSASRYHVLQERGGLAYYKHRYEEAEAATDEALRLATTLGDQQLMRAALGNHAALSAARGDLAQAVERGRALVLMQRRNRFDRIASNTLLNYAAALTEFGELDEALSVLREAAPTLARQGTWWIWLDTIALLAFKRGRIHDAALALGRFDAMFVKFNQPRYGPVFQRIRDEVLRGLQQVLTAAELERLLAEGAAMSDEEAARGALAD